MVLSVIGHGYVGLVTASVFADLGNIVWVIGRDKEKIERLKRGKLAFFEPGMEELVGRNLKAKRLHFTLDYKQAIPSSEIIFIAVGTPPTGSGKADLASVFDVAKKLSLHLSGYTVVAVKSTVPPGTNKKIKEIIEVNKAVRAKFDVASTPEFLSQGTAIENTLHPDRIVIGTESKIAEKLLVKLNKGIDGQLLTTNLETAEMIKYAANAMLATRVSFANTIALLCERVGADSEVVLRGVGLDKRIGRLFLSPGIGFGGSCLPKDTKALIDIGRRVGSDISLIEAVYEVNEVAREEFINKIRKMLVGQLKGSTVGVLGLSFKPNTDDMRDAPSIPIIRKLQQEGANVQAYDPVAQDHAKKILKDIIYCKNPYDVARNSDILVILTEWNEFKELDLERVKKLLKGKIIVDGRNIYDKNEVQKLGFKYIGVGR